MSSSYFAADRRPSSNAASPLFSPPVPVTPGSAPSRANALQTRIATILSASYADIEISDALQTLDSRGIKNTAETRRNLRLDLQQELIACNGEVVKDFGQVAEQLRRVGAALDTLNKTCSNIRTHVNAARKETAPMLDENKSLTAQRHEAETKRQLLEAFNKHFVLSEIELNALTSTALPIDNTFYTALGRLKQIHNDSQVLLGSEDQTLGLEVLEDTSRTLNSAYQKLFRWTQRSLRDLDLENPHLSTPIRQAFRILAERPQLFQSCLDFFAESRERTLADAFHAALTGHATPAISTIPTKPIELSAHEPLRYVSDMLAWLHAAAVGEREALSNLFISGSDADAISALLKAGRDAQPWLSDPSAPDSAFDGTQALSSLIDRDLAGVLRHLRQRIDQTVRSHEDALLAYQVANLCAFYRDVFIPLLGKESTVAAALTPLSEMGMDQFRLVTRDHISSLRNEIDGIGNDLGVPEWLEEALVTFGKLAKSFEASFTRQVGREEKEEGFEAVVKEALDPYLDGVENVGRRLEGVERVVFGLNCFGRVGEVVRGLGYVRGRAERVEGLMEGLKGRAVELVREWIVRESGMGEVFVTLKPWLENDEGLDLGKVRSLEVLQEDKLGEVAQQLDAFLPTSIEDARAYIGNLKDRALARAICEEAADDFVEMFEGVERMLDLVDEQLMKEKEEKDEEDRTFLRDVFPRTGDEIKVLLS
ncbi:oligomeric Golgi complex subunit 6 [Elsinoe ampelina]|uniref:Conserved oligomeric Golgi complex subunit 6 n=1 Tax=Elsinoe ampelina TaxID=302913 RepID=A0A6A6GPL2_9PEZI|nr:oligomeric Golgi complex subunit 6 [Elsinoe ampelina]